jgi:hypothetical protein
MLTLTGCKTPPAVPSALKPEDVDRVNETHVRIYLPQKNFSIEPSSVPAFDLSGGGGGDGRGQAIAIATMLLVVEPSIYAVRETDAHIRIQPLRSATRNVDFRGQYGQAISNALSSNCWLKPVRFDVIPTAAKTPGPNELAHSAVLNLETHYELTEDFCNLVTSSTLKLYLPGQSPVPAATNDISHTSTFFDGVKRAEAVRRWTTDNAAVFRRAVSESVEANAGLIRDAVDEMRR